jgi:transcriptional regulator CtsR
MALNDASLQFESVAAQVSEVIDACETERETFYPSAKWGQGGVVKCLAMQSHTVESVSTGCRLVLEKFGLI